MIAFEVISITLHLAAMLLAGEAVLMIYSKKEKSGQTCLSAFILLLIIFQSIMYVILDAMWVLNGHSEKISSFEDIGWIIQEWAVGVTLILIVNFIKIFLNWQGDCEC